MPGSLPPPQSGKETMAKKVESKKPEAKKQAQPEVKRPLNQSKRIR